jgi:hypothetical protein
MTTPSRIFTATLVASACAPVLIGAAITFRDGPFAPGLDFSMVAGSLLFALLWGFPITLVLLLLTAVPTYFLLRQWSPMEWWHGALAGLIIGGSLGLAGGSGFGGALVSGFTGVACGLLFRLVIGPDARERVE